jgi:hypothetical protein
LDFVRSYGGDVRVTTHLSGLSTSSLIDRALKQRLQVE